MSNPTREAARRSNTPGKLNGVIEIARQFPNLIEPWSEAAVPDYLALVDHSLRIKNKSHYEAELRSEEAEFNRLVRLLSAANKSLIVVLQGRDGAGKTGATIRITAALGYDFKIFQSVPVGPPSEEELAHHYLWRFHKHDRMPAYGQVRVLDRSWAERVLVERVMRLTAEDRIRASYAELRVYEWLLHSQGTVLVKLWLDITKNEQKKRFAERARSKPWKLSTSDAVARSHWDDYTPAANELFHRTGTDFAPWFILSSEDKRYSRVNALRIINQQLRESLVEQS